MPRILRHTLLVALVLGFVPASMLSSLAAPLPLTGRAPGCDNSGFAVQTPGWL